MNRVVCPGSFDPITYGHLDIIARASALFDEVVIAVLVNQTKKSLFTVDERLEMIAEVTSQFANVRVDSWRGLLVDYCETNQIGSIIKGLRAISDFDYELQMSQINFQLKGIETLFMSTSPAHSFLSSSLVKEVASYGGDVSSYLPTIIQKRLLDRLQIRKSQG